MPHVLDDPSGLSSCARRFVRTHGVRVPSWSVERHLSHWTGLGRPDTAIEALLAHQERWGGLALPPADDYEGGPYDLDADDPDPELFAVGRPRCSVPFAFAVDREGRFGVCGSGLPWVPLHSSVAGWVESLALTYHARQNAQTVRRLAGSQAEKLIAGLAGRAPAPEVGGLADNWWRTDNGYAWVPTGESLLFGGRSRAVAVLYEGVQISNAMANQT